MVWSIRQPDHRLKHHWCSSQESAVITSRWRTGVRCFPLKYGHAHHRCCILCTVLHLTRIYREHKSLQLTLMAARFLISSHWSFTNNLYSTWIHKLVETRYPYLIRMHKKHGYPQLVYPRTSGYWPTAYYIFFVSVFTFRRLNMSDVQSKDSEVESLEVSSDRRHFLQVASKACYAYLPVTGCVSCLLFTTHITNPRILQRWADIRESDRICRYIVGYTLQTTPWLIGYFRTRRRVPPSVTGLYGGGG